LTIYIFIPVSCCVGKGPQCTVLSGTYNAVKMALIVASVLLVEETGVPGGNHRPAASHWLLSRNVTGVIDGLTSLYILLSCDTFIRCSSVLLFCCVVVQLQHIYNQEYTWKYVYYVQILHSIYMIQSRVTITILNT
jgi:hypothetical protein